MVTPPLTVRLLLTNLAVALALLTDKLLMTAALSISKVLAVGVDALPICKVPPVRLMPFPLAIFTSGILVLLEACWIIMVPAVIAKFALVPISRSFRDPLPLPTVQIVIVPPEMLIVEAALDCP